MEGVAFLSSVVLPLTENAGEVERVNDLLGMLEHSFIAAFRIASPSDGASKDGSCPAPSVSTSSSIDAGEEARLLAARAVTNFHRNGAKKHRAFFERSDYHPHAALFMLELLKSLSGNSQKWFRRLQLDSLEACLAIVEAIGMDNVRLCLPGVVSVAVRYVHRSHHGKDSTKVCLTALKLLQTALTVAFESPDPASWVRDTVAHLTNTLRSILEPATLVRGAYDAATATAIKALVTALLVSPAISECLSTPLGSLLVVAFAVVENMEYLHHVGEDAAVAANTDSPRATVEAHPPESTKDACRLSAVLRGESAVGAIRDGLQCLRGVELLHVASTAVRMPEMRDSFFPLCCSVPAATATEVCEAAMPNDATPPDSTALFLSVIRKCIRVVGTEMSEEALYTHRHPRKYPAGVVDAFLFSFAGTLARLPGPGADAGVEETVGEQVTNEMLDEYDRVLQDWDAYAVHPAVLYVVTRLVVWQFHPAHALAGCRHSEVAAATLLASPDAPVECSYPSPCDFIVSGAFEQLWSVAAAPHLWRITQDEDLCNNQQVHHRQVVAAVLLRFLSLTAEVLSCHQSTAGAATGVAESAAAAELADARERLYALTLYLVLEKATAGGIVHEAAMLCVEEYCRAASGSDAVSFLLQHSSLIVDETARAVGDEYLRPAAASVLRGSLAFVEAHLARSSDSAQEEEAHGSGDEGNKAAGVHFCGSSTQITAVVRQRLSMAEMSAFFQRKGARLVSLHEAAQVADFVGSTIQVARDALRLCSRYDSTAVVEDLLGRRAALSLMRDALDLAAYLNFSVPQEPLDEDQERQTTSAHTRVRALQSVALEAIYAVLQYCSGHDKAAPVAVHAVVRGLTCFLTTNTAVEWAGKAREALCEAATQRRSEKRANSRKGRKKLMEAAPGSDLHGEDDEEEAADEAEERSSLPVPPPLDWPWTQYVNTSFATADDAASAHSSAVRIELPRSHLHTVYRVYLSLFALLREPVAVFGSVAHGPRARSGAERRKLGDVVIDPAVFETLNGLESIRLLARDFLLHRTVEEVLPLVVLWHERGCLPRIPTHTEERLKATTQQFVRRLYLDCSDAADLQGAMAARCTGFPLLSFVVGPAADKCAAAVPHKTASSLLVPLSDDSNKGASVPAAV